MFKELIFDKFSYSGDYTKRNHDFLNQHTLKINEETKALLILESANPAGLEENQMTYTMPVILSVSN
jgi:hypothetical protein